MYSMNKPYLINIIRKDVDGTAVKSILSSELRFSSISDAVSYINAYRNSYPVMIVAWVEKVDIFGIKKVVWLKSFIDSYGEPVLQTRLCRGDDYENVLDILCIQRR